MRKASIDQPRQTSDTKSESAPFEQLCPLFDSPSGPVQLARILEGPEYGRIAVLREIELNVLDAVLSGVVKARNLSHPSISKFLGVFEHAGKAYIASEYVQGVALFELMRASKERGMRVAPAASLRIIHEALVVAEQLRASRPDLQGERYLFPDTIWVAEYGATLLSEPGLVACLRPASRGTSSIEAGPNSGTGPVSSRSAVRTGSATDTQAAAVLLLQLLTSNAQNQDTCGQACRRAPDEVLRVIRRAVEFSSPGEMAQELAALPLGSLGEERDVAEAVRVLAGESLEARRLAANPPSLAGDMLGLEDETACFVGTALMDLHFENAPASPTQAASLFSSGERPVQPRAESYEEPTPLEEESDDDQEVTIAFRPSSIPRLIGRDHQATGEPQQPTTAFASGSGEPDEHAGNEIDVTVELGEHDAPAPVGEPMSSVIVTEEETMRGQRFRPRKARWPLALVALGFALAFVVALVLLG